MVQNRRHQQQQSHRLRRRSQPSDDDDSMDVDEPQVKLRTSDGMRFSLTKSVVSCSKSLRTMIESVQNNQSTSYAEYIYLPFVDSYTLEKVVEWQAIHAAQPDHQDATCMQQCTPKLSPSERAFLESLDEEKLLTVLHAANYLNIERLYDSCCRFMAKKWEGKRVDEIRRMYGIVSDLSAEEENQILQESTRLGMSD